MQSNLNLTIGLKGQLKLNAQAVPLQEGYLKVGGIAGAALTFGVVVSAAAATPDTFVPGAASGNTVRGVCVFDDAIAQNAPAHPNSYLEGLPCAALNHGFMYLGSWTKTGSAIDPVIGCKVIFNNTTGVIEFVASTATVPEGWSELAGASVRDVDTDNGALIYLN